MSGKHADKIIFFRREALIWRQDFVGFGTKPKNCFQIHEGTNLTQIEKNLANKPSFKLNIEYFEMDQVKFLSVKANSSFGCWCPIPT